MVDVAEDPVPIRVVGWGPFRMPGERKRWRRAMDAARLRASRVDRSLGEAGNLHRKTAFPAVPETALVLTEEGSESRIGTALADTAIREATATREIVIECEGLGSAVKTTLKLHPLDRLTADEIRSARRIIDEHGLLSPATRFALLALEEPPKEQVLAFQPGDPVDRRVRALLLDTATGAARTVVASLARGVIDTDVPVDPAVDGQPPILLEEYALV